MRGSRIALAEGDAVTLICRFHDDDDDNDNDDDENDDNDGDADHDDDNEQAFSSVS